MISKCVLDTYIAYSYAHTLEISIEQTSFVSYNVENRYRGKERKRMSFLYLFYTHKHTHTHTLTHTQMFWANVLR